MGIADNTMNSPANERHPLWRQPLLHFLLVGTLIFAVDAYRGGSEPTSNRIVLTVSQVERLTSLWQSTWGRAPSEAERLALVRDHIKEEIYYREALKLGLDVNDTVIRRRLQQKMEFLTMDDGAFAVADDVTLATYMQQNEDRYRSGPIFDFEQFYFSRDNIEALESALSILLEDSAAEIRGDSTNLPATMGASDGYDIARTFGSIFFENLAKLEPGSWHGPVESGFGVHIVRVSRIQPDFIPQLDDIRTTVENDWRAEQISEAEERAFEQLRSEYDISIEIPDE